VSGKDRDESTRAAEVESLLEQRQRIEIEIEHLRQEVTILYSDIVGYTQYTQSRGDVAGRLLIERHCRLVLPVVTRYGGTFVKTVGDAAMVRFDRPGPAVEAACAVLRSLQVENRNSSEEDRFHLRIGVATGKAIVEANDINGDVVNISARLCKMAEADGILVCHRTVEDLDAYLSGICIPCPERKVRGAEREPIRAYRVVWDPGSPAKPPQPGRPALILDIRKEEKQLLLSLQPGGSGHETVSQYETVEWNGTVVEEACSQIVQALKRATNVEGKRSLDEVRSAGSTLYDVLLTREIKDRLRETSHDALILRLQDELVNVPWELLYDGRSFFANRFALGRLVSSREKPREVEPIPTLHPWLTIISDPQGNLPAAHREGSDLAERFGSTERISVRMKANADIGYVRKALRQSTLIHYCGHAEYDDENPSGSGWLLSDGRLSAADIMQMAEGSKVSPLLVFANACHSGRAEEWSVRSQERIYGLAKAFLLSGVRHYIGTLWEVLDAPGHEFSTLFYGSLLRGRPIGVALRHARRGVIESRGEECLIWASYVLYGDPSVGIFGVAGEGETEPESVSAGDSGGATKPEVPGAAAHRPDSPGSTRTHSESGHGIGSPGRGGRWMPPSVMGLLIVLLLGALVWIGSGILTRQPPGPTTPPDPADTRAMLQWLAARANDPDYRDRVSADTWTSRPLDVAILPLEARGDIPADSPDLDRIRIILEREYAEVPGMQPLEREKLEQIMEELELGSSALADPASLARLGKMKAARLLLAGQLIGSGDTVEFHYRLFDTETTRLVSPGVLNVEDGAVAAAERAARESIAGIRERYPLQGRIIEAAGGDVYLNIGTNVGVEPGRTFAIIAEPKSEKMREAGLQTEIGELIIRETRDTVSSGEVTESIADVKKEMKVRSGSLKGDPETEEKPGS
jgi:class 3 adenylate cyclase/CHAT domain-containing protein